MKWLLVLLTIACSACGDLLSTAGMRRHGRVEPDAHGIARLFRALARNSFVLAGGIANALGFGSLIALLSIAEVSFAVPATAGTFVVEIVLGKLILHEGVRWQRWLGAALITVGVAVLALP